MNRGITTGFNKAFIINQNIKNNLISNNLNSKEIIKPLLRGKDISKYKIDFSNKYIIFSKQGINIKKYSAVLDYLEEYKEDLTPKNPGDSRDKRGRKQGNYKWYEIQDITNFYLSFEKKKIISQRVCKHPNFALSLNNEYLLDSMVFMTLNNENRLLLEYILMILNSNVIEWYLKRIGHKLGKNGFLLSNQYMKQLPIPIIPIEKQIEFKSMVLNLIELKKKVKSNDKLNNEINELEYSLNKITYTLFDLNKKEIELIEKDLFNPD